MYIAEKIIKLEPTLTLDDFHPAWGTIEILNGEIIRWEHPTVTQPEQSAIDAISDDTIIGEKNLVNLRAERNRKLAETDWTQSRDVTLTNDAAWTTYRQALRDITDTYSDLDSVVWPTKPE